jgi:hypothetical protein
MHDGKIKHLLASDRSQLSLLPQSVELRLIIGDGLCWSHGASLEAGL